MSHAAAAAGTSFGKGARDSSGDDDGEGGETGDVGDLLAELSVNDSLDAISSRGGGGEVQRGSAGGERQDEGIEMGEAGVQLEGGGGGGGGKAMGSKERSSRRLTAEKLTVESLLGSLDSPSPVMTATEIGEAASGLGGEGGGEASSGRRDDSDTDEDSDDSGEGGNGARFAEHDARWDGEERAGGQVRLRTVWYTLEALVDVRRLTRTSVHESCEAVLGGNFDWLVLREALFFLLSRFRCWLASRISTLFSLESSGATAVALQQYLASCCVVIPLQISPRGVSCVLWHPYPSVDCRQLYTLHSNPHRKGTCAYAVEPMSAVPNDFANCTSKRLAYSCDLEAGFDKFPHVSVVFVLAGAWLDHSRCPFYPSSRRALRYSRACGFPFRYR